MRDDERSDPAGSPSATKVRDEVRAWLADQWHGDGAQSRRDWLERLVDSGWAAPSWPRQQHGRGLDPSFGRIVEEEFRAVGAPGTGQDKVNLWANTVLAFGSDELKERFVRPLMLGRGQHVPAVLRTGCGLGPGRDPDQGRSATATSGSSTVRRCGPPVAARPTTPY